MKIIPTVFSKNKKQFQERFSKLVPISKNLHIDFMDGKFVNGKSISVYQIPDLKNYDNNFEAHLMMKSPIREIKELKERGFKKVIFHYESFKKDKMILKVIEMIKRSGMSVFIAVNPKTEVERVFPFLDDIDGVMFMGVHPGREHQEFIEEVYNKIKSLRKKDKKVKIQIDGGVDEKVIVKLSLLGVDYVNSGSYISEAENPKEALEKLAERIKY